MAGNVVNLRNARKQKTRDEKSRQAAQNRVVFGQTKAEKSQRKANEELDTRRLDQLQRETGDDGKDE